MNLKSLTIAVVALAVLSGAAFFIRRPAPAAPSDPRIGKPIAEQSLLTAAVRLKVLHEGTTVELVRQTDGSWIVPASYNMAVDFSKLSQLFTFFTAEKLERLVTSNPEIIGRLEFATTRISFLDAAGKETWSISLGKEAENGGRYLRMGDEQKAFYTSASIYLDAEVKNWVDTGLVNLKNDDIAKIELEFPSDGTTLVASRQKAADPLKAENAPAGRTLKSTFLGTVMGSDGGLRFQEHFDPADPKATEPRSESRRVKFTTFAGRTIEIQLSRKPETKIVKAPTAPAADRSGPASFLDAATKSDQKDTMASGPTSAVATETVPPGPVFVVVKDSDAKSRITELMQRRAFQVQDYALTSLPQKLDDALEPASAAK